MDPYSSPYIIPNNGPRNPFPHALLSTRRSCLQVAHAVHHGRTIHGLFARQHQMFQNYRRLEGRKEAKKEGRKEARKKASKEARKGAGKEGTKGFGCGEVLVTITSNYK